MSRSALPHRLAQWTTTLLVLVASALPSHAGELKAPPFSVKSIEGRVVRLADLRNKPVILDFWATWCGPCRNSMPHLNDIQARYGTRGLTVIGLSVDENGPAPVKRFALQTGMKFTVAMANDDVLDAYGPIRSIPTTFFINRKGEVVRRVIGFIDPETLDGYVREILP